MTQPSGVQPTGVQPTGVQPGMGDTLSAPTIITEWASGNVTVSIEGTAAATHYLLYSPIDRTEWLEGGSRNGDGDIVLSGLDHGRYRFVAYSELEGRRSRPSGPRERYVPGTGESAFAILRGLICADVEALQNEAGQALFISVGTWMDSPTALRCPACNVRPEDDPDELDGITNVATFTRCRFSLGFALKGVESEDMVDSVLYYREVMREWFESSADYSAVQGFVSIVVENHPVAYQGKGPSGALLFESGLVVVVTIMRQTH